MANDELKKLRRSDLLELLLEQTKEVDRLKEELAEAEEKLAQQELRFRESRSVLESVDRLNEIIDKTQQTADQYLREIKARRRACEEQCAANERKSREKAEKLIARTEEQCRRLRSQAQGTQAAETSVNRNKRK